MIATQSEIVEKLPNEAALRPPRVKVIVWYILFVGIAACIVFYYKDKKYTHATTWLPESGKSQVIVFWVWNLLMLIPLHGIVFNTLVRKRPTIWLQGDMDVKEQDSSTFWSSNLNWGIKKAGINMSFLRGRHYYHPVGAPPTMVFSLFNLSHFLAYFIGGFLCPDMFWAWVATSTWWEILETLKELDCWDLTDFIYNWSGLLLGLLARNSLDNYYAKKG